MSDSRSERLYDGILLSRNEANRLLAIAQHDSMRRIVRSALRDLDEAVLWLREPNIDERPGVLAVPVMALSTAEAKLEQVGRSINVYGPRAERIPE